MRRVIILGSTGSVGINTLKVIAHHRKKFKVVGLTAGSNINLLQKQIKRFSPRAVALSRIDDAGVSSRLNLGKTRLFLGKDAAQELVKTSRADLAVVAIGGSSALYPLLAAIKRYPLVALANKEALVMAGEIIMRTAQKYGVKILPLDSEHNAIFQCLQESPSTEVKRIYLTGSGGPLKDISGAKLNSVSINEVLKHPKWKMGKKISVDSASLMNKGLEIIEAMRLFGLPLEKIKVLIHPQAVVHSMVEFIDGSILAQLALPDMRIPINYALNYPQRIFWGQRSLNFSRLQQLSFCIPDRKKFPCLDLAMFAARSGGSLPCVLNAVNEECVQAFLNKKIKFTDIPRIIAKVLPKHRTIAKPALGDIIEIDHWAREHAHKLIQKEI